MFVWCAAPNHTPRDIVPQTMEEHPVKRLFCLLSVATLSLALVACGERQQAPEVAQPSAQPAPAAAIDAASPAKSGKVIETMNAAGYTYVHVDTGTEQFWAAAPETAVKVGDTVGVPEGMPMANFQSKALNRTFDVVYFVPALITEGGGLPGAPVSMPAGHPPTVNGMADSPGAPKVTAPAEVTLKGIAKADQTVADIYAQKTELAGKPVKVRGKVVKFSSGIMGKNWVHLQDGSGQPGSNDLTVTTLATANIGDTVLVSGNLTVGKDFGYGYQYDVIIEDAKVTKE
jgi:hypothetical protein